MSKNTEGATQFAYRDRTIEIRKVDYFGDGAGPTYFATIIDGKHQWITPIADGISAAVQIGEELIDRGEV